MLVGIIVGFIGKPAASANTLLRMDILGIGGFMKYFLNVK